MKMILNSFENLGNTQIARFEAMGDIYSSWNEKINLISRKDLENFYERHVLHSLAIAKVITFRDGTTVLDAGSGGGFPGIPLAIMFPGVSFHLVDSTKKKLLAVGQIANSLGLENITTEHVRLEDHEDKYDFVVGRAVTSLPGFHEWTGKNIRSESFNEMPNGTFYLKGEDVESEFLAKFRNHRIWELSRFFKGAFFETKRLVYFSDGR